MPTQFSAAAAADIKQCLNLAKSAGSDDEIWQQVYSLLRKHQAQYSDLVNDKAGRNYALLHFAGSSDNQSACRLLVEEFGADPTILTERGETPADLARRRGHSCRAAQLDAYEEDHRTKVQAQADAKRKLLDELGEEEIRNWLPPAIEAFEAALEQLKTQGDNDDAWCDLYNILEQHGKDFPNLVNERGGRNYALLHMAALHGNANACRILIREYGADIILRTQTGETAGELAIRKGHTELGQELKLQEGDTEEELKRHLANVKSEGENDEAWAVVYEFLKANKVANNMAGLNFSFLHHAASWGNNAACRTLIEQCGADPFMRTRKKRELPEDIARKHQHSWTERILQNFAQGDKRNWNGDGRSVVKRARTEATEQPSEYRNEYRINSY